MPRRITIEQAEQAMSVGEAARRLDLSVSMIHKLLRSGRLIATKTAIGHLISRKSIAAEKRRRRRIRGQRGTK